MVTTESAELFKLYNFYTKQVFIYNKGLFELPNRYLKSMEYIEFAMNKIENLNKNRE